MIDAVVVFQSFGDFSSGVWIADGEHAPDFIRASVPHLMRGVTDTSSARFCGCCHAWIDSNRGLALCPPPKKGDNLEEFASYREDVLHPGGGHLYIVDIDSGQVSGFGGAKSFTIDNFEKVCPA
jgi:hypothetical protein